MEKINFGYSLKNIPIPAKQGYVKSFIDKTGKFLKRIRWKAYFFDNPADPNTERPQTFGFPSEKTPPPNKDLTAFENEMYNMIKNIHYSESRRSAMQSKFGSDIKNMKQSNDLYVSADKTTNLYKMSKDEYNKLLHSNITTNYKKDGVASKTSIDHQAKQIACKLGIEDRAECYAPRESFITLKDHKDNFANNPKCRLINPAKSEIGLVSKQLLEKVVSEVHKKSPVNQWRQTASVIDWFTNIKDKRDCRFFQLDIADFYPSISEELLNQAIDYAKQTTPIDNSTLEIIQHARKSLLFDQRNTWIKRGNPHFDVTMGSYDGAEICELVGLYLLSEIKVKFADISFGLYRDDGLGITRKLSGPQTERLKKEIIKFFQSKKLKITIECNMHQVDFLDVTFDLRTGRYRPYRKPNDTPLYIHRESNHPPNILKQLPNMIAERISSISCNQDEFDKAKDTYNNSLKMSGFSHDIKYTDNATPGSKPHQRERKVIWFNPPYNLQVKTNIGASFLASIAKHFPPSHKYHKIFNKNTIKLSYSCTPSVGAAIAGHNKRILSPASTSSTPQSAPALSSSQPELQRRPQSEMPSGPRRQTTRRSPQQAPPSSPQPATSSSARPELHTSPHPEMPSVPPRRMTRSTSQQALLSSLQPATLSSPHPELRCSSQPEMLSGPPQVMTGSSLQRAPASSLQPAMLNSAHPEPQTTPQPEMPGGPPRRMTRSTSQRALLSSPQPPTLSSPSPESRCSPQPEMPSSHPRRVTRSSSQLAPPSSSQPATLSSAHQDLQSKPQSETPSAAPCGVTRNSLQQTMPSSPQHMRSATQQMTRTDRQPREDQMCNCRDPTQCPMLGRCLESSIIYKATISSTEADKHYFGATETSFKKRFANHKESFAKESKSSATTLSKHVWDLKRKGMPHSIKWEIVKRCGPYRCGTRRCDLCLSEKYYILEADSEHCLNKNSELLQKCRHANKFKLANIA